MSRSIVRSTRCKLAYNKDGNKSVLLCRICTLHAMPIRTIIYVFYYEEMGAFVPCKIINVWSPKSVINIAKNMECQHITQQ